jgi:anti-sigma factor ChrR (cupin superfamily)
MKMKHEHPTEEIQTLAALYALGALEAPEAIEFQAHLDDGCPTCEAEVHAFEAVAHQLAFSRPPMSPSPQVRERLMDRISQDVAGRRTMDNPQVWKNWTPTPEQPRWVVRGHEGDWQPTSIEGVSVKNLFVDDARHYVTMLVRMMPGSYYPSHRHSAAEECYVVQGDMYVGRQRYFAGDYIRNSAESVDEDICTEGGCLLFIVSSQQDEVLPYVQ